MNRFECYLYVASRIPQVILEDYESLVVAQGGEVVILKNLHEKEEWKKKIGEQSGVVTIEMLIADVPLKEFSTLLPLLSSETSVFYISPKQEDLSVFRPSTYQMTSHEDTIAHLKENLSNYILGWEEGNSSKKGQGEGEEDAQKDEPNEPLVDENLDKPEDSTDTTSTQEAEEKGEAQDEPKTTIKGTPILTDEQQVNYQENPYQKRARKLQKQVFAKHRWDDHHTIGIWSPIPRMGVTSLTMNFGFYLAKRSVYTAVLEGLTERHALKDWLKRYTDMPTDWKSLAYAIQNDSAIEHTNWNYKNVTFLPLDRNDPHAEWNHDSLESYITTTRVMDVTLVDLPTGKMESYTKDSLQFLDQLWIVVDDAFQETVAWKDYIKELEDAAGIPIYLVFNKTYEFSQTERMQKALGYPLLTTLPALHEETMRSYYESTPLYFQAELQPLLDEGFDELAHHLFKEPLPSKVTEEKQKLGWMRKILKPLLT